MSAECVGAQVVAKAEELRPVVKKHVGGVLARVAAFNPRRMTEQVGVVAYKNIPPAAWEAGKQMAIVYRKHVEPVGAWVVCAHLPGGEGGGLIGSDSNGVWCGEQFFSKGLFCVDRPCRYACCCCCSTAPLQAACGSGDACGQRGSGLDRCAVGARAEAGAEGAAAGWVLQTSVVCWMTGVVSGAHIYPSCVGVVVPFQRSWRRSSCEWRRPAC